MAGGIAVEEKPVFTEPSAYGHQRIASAPEPGGVPNVKPITDALSSLAKNLGTHYENLAKHEQEAAYIKAQNDISSGLLAASQRAQQQTDWTQIAQSFADDSASIKTGVLNAAPDQYTQQRIHAFYDEAVLRTSAAVAQNVQQKKHDALRADGDKSLEWALTNVANDPEKSEDGAPLNNYTKKLIRDLADSQFRSGARTREGADAWATVGLQRADQNAAIGEINKNPLKAQALLEAKNPQEQDQEGVSTWKNFIDLPLAARYELIAKAKSEAGAQSGNVDLLIHQGVRKNVEGNTDNPVTEDMLRAMHASAKKIEEWRGMDAASKDARSTLVQVADTPTGETDAVVKKWMDKAEVGGAGMYHMAMKDMMLEAYAKDTAMRKDDPAGYVYLYNKDAHIPSTPEERDQWVISHERHLKIPERVLSNAELTAYVTQFNKAPGDAKVGVIAQISHDHGVVYGNKIASEMINGGVSSNFPLMFGQTKGQTLSDIARSGDIDVAKQEGLMSADARKKFNGDLEDQWSAISSRLDPDPKMQFAYHEAFKRLALSYVGSETDPVGAAFKNAYFDNYYENTPFAIPKAGVPPEKVSAIVGTAAAIRRNLPQMDINLGTDDPNARAVMMARMQAPPSQGGARWVPALNDRGAVLMMGRNVVLNNKNEPIQFRYSMVNAASRLEEVLPEEALPTTMGAYAGTVGAPATEALLAQRQSALDAARRGESVPGMTRPQMDRINKEVHDLSRPTGIFEDSEANPPSPKDRYPKPVSEPHRRRR